MMILCLRCLFFRRYVHLQNFTRELSGIGVGSSGGMCTDVAFEQQLLIVWYLHYIFRKYVDLSSIRNLTVDGVTLALHLQKVRAAVYLNFNC
jgi:hypothetical protein